VRRAVRVVVSGRVQGVGFRDWTQREALARDLAGWVRNRRDGTVEAVFAGEGADVDAMLTALRDGPPASRVKQVAAEDWPGAVPSTFEFRETA
jgi:acylphosphatase